MDSLKYFVHLLRHSFTQVPFSLEILSIWFNCFCSWSHGGVHLSTHLSYLFYTMDLNLSIVKSWWVRWTKARSYLKRLQLSFTIAVTPGDLLAPCRSDEFREFLQLRLCFTHSSCSLGLNTWLLPHWARNGLQLGFLNAGQKGIDSEKCHFPGPCNM